MDRLNPEIDFTALNLRVLGEPLRLPADEPVEQSIDGLGDLLVRPKGKLDVRKQALVPALRKRAWYDIESQSLKL